MQGRAFKFGDNISTDHIAPGRLFHLRSDLNEFAKHVLEDADETFASTMKKGDFVVAGIGSAFVFILFLILGAIKNNNRMLVIIRGDRTKESQIQGVIFKFFGAKAVLRVKNSTTDSIEFIYEITAKLLSQAERKNNIGICDEIYKIGNIQYVNTVMQNDEVSN